METHFVTPDPTLALSADGVLVARSPGLAVREPTRAELLDGLAAAFGRVMDAAVLTSRASTSLALLSSSGSQHDQYEKVRQVFEKAPVFHEFTEFAFAIGDLMGWTLPHDPLLEQVKVIDGLLHAYFKAVDAQIFASWSSTRLAMLADVQALASSARETMRSIVQNGDDLDAPLTVSRLALADRDSLLAINTFTSAVESGYWLRPNSAGAVGLDAWGTKFDDRAPVYADGTVWDPRLALPTLLYALAVRVVVLKAMHSSRRRYCHEINQRVAFLLQVQMHWQTGIRRKLQLSTYERSLWGGFHVVPFAAGAVDVFTGNHDLIDVDVDALNLSQALGFYAGPLPAGAAPIPPEAVAPNITEADIGARDMAGLVNNGYGPILGKQAAVAFTRLRWSTGLHAFSDTIKALGEICATAAGDDVVGTYRQSLPLVRESSRGDRAAGGVEDAQERAELALALARLVHPRGDRRRGGAMVDRYALYSDLRGGDSALLSELRDLVERHVRRERPWHRRADSGKSDGNFPE